MPSAPDDTASAPTPPPDQPDSGEPPAAAPAEPFVLAEPLEPLPLRVWERPGVRQTIWVVAVFLALLLMGVVFTPRYWRF